MRYVDRRPGLDEPSQDVRIMDPQELRKVVKTFAVRIVALSVIAQDGLSIVVLEEEPER